MLYSVTLLLQQLLYYITYPYFLSSLSFSQPARKRHKSAHAALSPPPISSLSTPSHNPSSLQFPYSPTHSGPVIVPNEKSIRKTNTNIATGNSRESWLLGATLRPNNSAVGKSSSSAKQTDLADGKAAASSLSLSSSPSLLLPASSAAGANLSSLKFTAPPPRAPPTSRSPDHSKHLATPPNSGTGSRLNFSPNFHAANVSLLMLYVAHHHVSCAILKVNDLNFATSFLSKFPAIK